MYNIHVVFVLINVFIVVKSFPLLKAL